MSTSVFEEALHTRIRHEAGRLTWLGAGLLLLGVAALLFPEVATVATTLFVAWVLIISGALSLFGAFSIRGAGPFFGALLVGLLSVAAGVFILARPLIGVLAITLSLGALFMVQGAFELVLAFEVRPARGWIWMLISAIASIALAVIILAGWPGSSAIALGVVLGVNFISSGLAYLLLGGAARRKAA
jgi:uncharacterized membrane protein HdeD (DUF308 family)